MTINKADRRIYLRMPVNFAINQRFVYTFLFFMPRVGWSGAYCFFPVFCLSVCLSTLNVCYNFWIVRDKEVIFQGRIQNLHCRGGSTSDQWSRSFTEARCDERGRVGKGVTPSHRWGSGVSPEFFETLHKSDVHNVFWVHFEVINTLKIYIKTGSHYMYIWTIHFFIFKCWEIYIRMVHSDRILIYISTTESLYERSTSLYRLFRLFSKLNLQTVFICAFYWKWF